MRVGIRFRVGVLEKCRVTCSMRVWNSDTARLGLGIGLQFKLGLVLASG